jgi:hypothetical protein
LVKVRRRIKVAELAKMPRERTDMTVAFCFQGSWTFQSRKTGIRAMVQSMPILMAEYTLPRTTIFVAGRQLKSTIVVSHVASRGVQFVRRYVFVPTEELKMTKMRNDKTQFIHGLLDTCIKVRQSEILVGMLDQT